MFRHRLEQIERFDIDQQRNGEEKTRNDWLKLKFYFSSNDDESTGSTKEMFEQQKTIEEVQQKFSKKNTDQLFHLDEFHLGPIDLDNVDVISDAISNYNVKKIIFRMSHIYNLFDLYELKDDF